MRSCLYFILFFIQIAPLFVLAQKQNFTFKHLTPEDGLSHSNILSMIEDSRGFMWIGTKDGLNKYDGYKFTLYKNDPKDSTSVSNDYITAIFEDSKKLIWVGTWGGGLNVFDRNKNRFTSFRYNVMNDKSISADFINTILEDSQGQIWIGTEGGGLDLFDPETKSFHHNKYDVTVNDNFVKDIIEDHDHNLWIGTRDKGLQLFDRKKKTFTGFVNSKKDSSSISQNNVSALFEDSRHQIWVGTNSEGLNLLNAHNRTFTRFKSNVKNTNSISSNNVRVINEDNLGNLWIGTENGGLNIFNPNAKKFNPLLADDLVSTSLNNNSIYSIFRDIKGNMWVGTFTGGINILIAENAQFQGYTHNSSENSLSHNNVLGIFQDSKDNIWIGTDGGGLNLFDEKTGDFKHFFHEPGNKKSICGNYVLSIEEDDSERLWIGTWGDGLTVWDRKKNTYSHFKNDPANSSSLSSNNAWVIFKDSDKQMWIGTYHGSLDLYEPKTKSFKHYMFDKGKGPALSNTIRSITQDRKGDLWIGTDDGLYQFDKKTEVFTHYEHIPGKPSLSNNTVACIHEDRQGNLWISTISGLNFLNRKTNIFSTFTMSDGLPSNMIFGILEDTNGNLWVSTHKGLSNYNPATRKFTNFDVTDGLQSNEFREIAYCKSKSGAFYFGGNNGFNKFYPKDIRENSFEPPLLLTDFQIFSKPVPIAQNSNDPSPLKKSISETEKVEIPYRYSVISFEFASLNYTIEERKQYSYKLEGFDKEWNDIGTRRTATYTNLDPGNYVFKVRGLNNSGKWSSRMAVLQLTVIPPFWLTLWFRVFVCAGAAGAALMFYLWRMKSVILQKNKLQLLVNERTSQLLHSTEEERKAREEAEQANRAKSVFLATMSHEIRTPMNGMIGMASLLAETEQTREQQAYTETITSCGENLLSVINDILDFSKIESGKMELEESNFSLLTCIEEVLDVFGPRAVVSGIDLVYLIQPEVPSHIVGDCLRLRQILINLVGNAIKFTQHGEIFVEVHLIHKSNEEVRLEFRVRDTGIGIPAEKIDRLFKAFSQVDSSTTRKYGGSGLGLVISEKLVTMMGGSIEVVSTPGEGATFSFTIQALAGEAPAAPDLNFPAAAVHGKRVLVVDDNLTNRYILKKQLEQWHLVTTLANSAEHAIEVIEKEPAFDLILTDMQMPGMNGIELAQQVHKKYPFMPIVLLSSIGDDSGKKYPSLFKSVLTKPIHQHALRYHIFNELHDPGEMHLVEPKPVKQRLLGDFSENHPLKILIAEDNPVNQQLAIRVLNKLGYFPAIAENGQEVLDILEKEKFDLILMDVQMPEMDGLEATRLIRLRSSMQPVIIAMTANAMKSDEEECRQAGMDDFLSKPINIDQLVSVLKKWSLKLMFIAVP